MTGVINITNRFVLCIDLTPCLTFGCLAYTLAWLECPFKLAIVVAICLMHFCLLLLLPFYCVSFAYTHPLWSFSFSCPSNLSSSSCASAASAVLGSRTRTRTDVYKHATCVSWAHMYVRLFLLANKFPEDFNLLHVHSLFGNQCVLHTLNCWFHLSHATHFSHLTRSVRRSVGRCQCRCWPQPRFTKTFCNCPAKVLLPLFNTDFYDLSCLIIFWF